MLNSLTQYVHFLLEYTALLAVQQPTPTGNVKEAERGQSPAAAYLAAEPRCIAYCIQMTRLLKLEAMAKLF